MENQKTTASSTDQTFELRLLYALVGIAAGLGLLHLFYWSLRLNSSIASLIEKTAHAPTYLWLYAILTIATVILFGIHVSLLVYQWRTFGGPNLKGGTSSAVGGIIGIFASACPSCGSLLLSAIGITSGLLAFPLAGLELKILSLILVAVPLMLLTKKLKKAKELCATGACPVPHEDAFKQSDKKWVAIFGLAVIVMAIALYGGVRKEFPRVEKNETVAAVANPMANALFAELTEKVTPKAGFQSTIKLGDAIVKLTAQGVIDMAKVETLYADQGGTPAVFADIATRPSDVPILLTSENAPYYLNALWALGIANHMETNNTSPVVGPDLFNFASTGGWTLGTEENGGAYFNKFQIVSLTPEQEALVRRVGENTYRPCCDNSSFFQDCNHGSAILGLLQLGAAQGLDEAALYEEAMHFNAYWFPQQYIETAMYFQAVKGIEWDAIDPRVVMSKSYSSGSGWYKNVLTPLKEEGLIPDSQISGTGC